MKKIFSNFSKAKSRNEKILPEFKSQSNSKINNLYKSEKKYIH